MRSSSWKSLVRRHPIATALSLLLLAGLAWAAFAPIPVASHDARFEIPRGTWANRMAGKKTEIFPQTIQLTLGLKDVLVLSNADTVPHIFGPTLIMPGQSFRLPFDEASTYSFQCTAHPNGGLSVIVDPFPAPGWQRLYWRLRGLTSAV